MPLFRQPCYGKIHSMDKSVISEKQKIKEQIDLFKKKKEIRSSFSLLKSAPKFKPIQYHGSRHKG